MSNRIREKAWRSLAKTLSWRILATLTTLAIAYYITGNLAVASIIGALEFFAKILLYYLHERMWNQIRIGFQLDRPPDYQI